MEDVSRRGFLFGSVATAFAATAFAAAPATAQAFAPERRGTPLDGTEDGEPAETLNYDFVVCGSGTAGLCAASHGAELGMKVLLVDPVTENGVGGSSRYVENLGTLRGRTPDVWFTDLVGYHRYASDPLITRRVANEALSVVAWTDNNQGVKRNARSKYEEDGKGTSGGLTAVLTMYEYCKKLGVDFLFDARAYKLLTDDKGAICGVKTKSRAGKITQINCKAVDLATGGFGANREMFERYTNIPYDRVIARGSVGTQVGDGIIMAQQLGAMLHHPEAVNFCSPILPGHYNKGALTIAGVNQADTCFFNPDGRRFCDESIIDDWTLSGNVCSQQRAVYVVVDQDYVDKVMNGDGVVTRRSNYFEVGDKAPTFQAEIDAAIKRENPRVFKANNIKDFGNMVDVDGEGLAAEIAKFNTYVDEGKDEEFLKDPKYLRKIEKAPFYLFHTQLAFYNTCGGLKIDDHTRVLNHELHPIKGLYASGMDAGGLFGPYYDVSIAPGSTQLWCRVSGYWAAEAAKADVC